MNQIPIRPAVIEVLIARLERGYLRDGYAQLVGGLLRLLLRLIAVLQQKDASLARLKRMTYPKRFQFTITDL